jgi:hypothetical protein
MTETKTPKLPVNPDEGMYLHDLVSKDYDAAIDEGKPTVDESKEFVYELPGSGFHDAGMYNEKERQSDGAHYDEANGQSYKEDVDEATLAEQQFGAKVIGEHELELVLNPTDEVDPTEAWLAAVEADPSKADEATAKWEEIVSNNSGEAAKQQASQQWFEEQKKQQ